MKKIGAEFRRCRWCLRIILSVVVLLIVINWVGGETFIQALMSLDASSLVVIFILVSISIAVRGWRAKVAQESALVGPSFDYVMIAIFHNAANQVMPFRSGEFSFPLLVKHYIGHSMSRSAASLLLIRFVEVMVLSGLVIIGVLFMLGDSGEGQRWVLPLLLVMLLMFAVWFFMSRLLLFGARFFGAIAGRGRGKYRGFILKLTQVLRAIAEELGRGKDAKVHFLIIILTIFNWLLLIGVSWSVLLSLGVQVSYAETIVGSSVASVAQFIPLGSFGNVGPLEAGWTLGFVLVGLDAKTALNAGVILHLIMISYALILAGFGWLVLKWRER